jgi:hypothetical protein
MRRAAHTTVLRRSVALACATALLTGCGRSGEQATTDTGAASAAAGGDTAAPAAGLAAPTPVSLADWAGTWQGRSMPADRDTVVATWTLVSKADTAGWTIQFPNRRPLPVRVVSTQGDSVVLEFGPYESTTRRGQRQTVRGVSRMQDGRLVGTYETRLVSTPDSVFRGRSEATRAP